MNEEIFEKIKSLVEENQGRYGATMNRTTRLEKDLKISGTDAYEFIIAYGTSFNVDISNFMFRDYFEDEGLQLVDATLRFFLPCIFKSYKKDLTLEDLENGVIAGRLDEDIINIRRVATGDLSSK